MEAWADRRGTSNCHGSFPSCVLAPNIRQLIPPIVAAHDGWPRVVLRTSHRNGVDTLPHHSEKPLPPPHPPSAPID